MEPSQISHVGALLADDTRAGILTALMDGRAHTGGELSRSVGVSPSTASGHLSKLLNAGMVAVEAQGRHRYFRLAGPDVAALLETVGASAPVTMPAPRSPAALNYTRTCYDHLAGQLAVEIYNKMLTVGHVRLVDGHPRITETGATFLAGVGVDLEASRSRRPMIRACLDWTERRHHLAGTAGARLLSTMLDRGWLTRGSRPRSLRTTSSGRSAIAVEFSLAGPIL